LEHLIPIDPTPPWRRIEGVQYEAYGRATNKRRTRYVAWKYD